MISEHVSTSNGTFIEKHLQDKITITYIICRAVFILLENNGSIFIDIFLNMQKVTANKIIASRSITVITT